MQRCEQNGACSADKGARHTGQDLESEVLGISTMDGERRLTSQGDRAADLPFQRFDPVASPLKRGNHRRMRYELLRARCLQRDAAHQCASLERRAIRREFEQGRPAARPHDLEKAEAEVRERAMAA